MKVLKLLLVLLVLTGIYCGGDKKTETKADATKPARIAAAPANAAAEGFPPEAFAELTEPEITKYVKALPAVSEAFRTAGYRSKSNPGASIMADIAATIEGMKTVPGMEAALKKGGTTWPEFRVTTFKVISANASLAIGMAAAMAESDSTADPKIKAEIKKAKDFFDGVPKKNQELVFSHMDDLKALDQLDQN